MNKETIKELLFDGFSVTKKDVMICDLRAHLPNRLNHSRCYQVYSRDFQDIFYNLDDAVDKFEELCKPLARIGG